MTGRDRFAQRATIDDQRGLATSLVVHAGVDLELLGVEFALHGPQLEAAQDEIDAALVREQAVSRFQIHVQRATGRRHARRRLTGEQVENLWIEGGRIQADARRNVTQWVEA